MIGPSIDEMREAALVARARGESFVRISVPAHGLNPWSPWIRCYGIVGRVVQRIRGEGDVFETFLVDYNIIDVMEAHRRRTIARLEGQTRPLRVNRKTVVRITTAR